MGISADHLQEIIFFNKKNKNPGKKTGNQKNKMFFFVQIVEKRMKKNPILFSSYSENSSKIYHILNTKMAATQKMKIDLKLYQ